MRLVWQVDTRRGICQSGGAQRRYPDRFRVSRLLCESRDAEDPQDPISGFQILGNTIFGSTNDSGNALSYLAHESKDVFGDMSVYVENWSEGFGVIMAKANVWLETLVNKLETAWAAVKQFAAFVGGDKNATLANLVTPDEQRKADQRAWYEEQYRRRHPTAVGVSWAMIEKDFAEQNKNNPNFDPHFLDRFLPGSPALNVSTAQDTLKNANADFDRAAAKTLERQDAQREKYSKVTENFVKNLFTPAKGLELPPVKPPPPVEFSATLNPDNLTLGIQPEIKAPKLLRWGSAKAQLATFGNPAIQSLVSAAGGLSPAPAPHRALAPSPAPPPATSGASPDEKIAKVMGDAIALISRYIVKWDTNPPIGEIEDFA